MSGKIGHFNSPSEIYDNGKSWYFVINKLLLSINSSMTIILKNLQKQEIIEKPKQHTTYTESDDSNEYENEEMSSKVTEGRVYKQLLAQGMYAHASNYVYGSIFR